MNAVFRFLAVLVIVICSFSTVWFHTQTADLIPAGWSPQPKAEVQPSPRRFKTPVAPVRSEEEIAALIGLGEDLYLSDRMQCAICHGQEGDGMVGPSLLDHSWLKESHRTNFHRIVTVGLGEDVMPGVKATQRETDAMRLFLQKLSEEYAE